MLIFICECFIVVKSVTWEFDKKNLTILLGNNNPGVFPWYKIWRGKVRCWSALIDFRNIDGFSYFETELTYSVKSTRPALCSIIRCFSRKRIQRKRKTTLCSYSRHQKRLPHYFYSPPLNFSIAWYVSHFESSLSDTKVMNLITNEKALVEHIVQLELQT